MGTPRSRDQEWWDRRRFGLLVHTSTAAVPAWAPIGQYAEWYQAHIDGAVKDVLLHPSPLVEALAHHQERWAHVERFTEFTELLTFDAFDPDEWAQLALDAGMTYTVMVAKHHDGLCWWDAPGTGHTVIAAGPRRNVLGEYAGAARDAGLVFGTYYSLLDWHEPSYPSCAYVDDLVHPQVLDLVERYGSRMLWGDGHWGGGGSHWRSDELLEAARRIDPAVISNDRWWADGPGIRSFEYRIPPEITASAWEMRRGLGGSFSYNRAETPDHLLSADGIVALLAEVLAKGGHLLLSVGPDSHGRIPPVHARRLRAAGRWVSRHRRLVDEARPWTTWGDDQARYVSCGGDVYVIDVSGHGRFDALAERAGRAVSVHRVDGDGIEHPIDFDQLSERLVLLPRARYHPSSRDPDTVHTEVYRVALEPLPPAPIELFPAPPPSTIELAPLLTDASPGQIVQLGDGMYVGPAHVPDGVTLRGLGPGRTSIDGIDGLALTLGRHSRAEHCTIRGGGPRIAWLPNPVVRLAGVGASLLGCRVDGHVDVTAADARLISCAMTGALAADVDRLSVLRCTCTGMNWDCAIDITGGTGHVVESCEIGTVLQGVRLTRTVDAHVRGNRIHARWWGVQAIDTEATRVVGNAFSRTMRAVDIEGGIQAEVTGNAVGDGDSGCVVQRGASDTTVAGNRWERTRIGLLAWDAGTVRHHDNATVDLLEPDHAVLIGP